MRVTGRSGEKRTRAMLSQEPSTLPAGPHRARRPVELKGDLAGKGQTGEEEQRQLKKLSVKKETFRKGRKKQDQTRSCVTSATTGREKNKSGFRERAGGHTSGKMSSQLRMKEPNVEIIQCQVSYPRWS